MAEWLKAHAWSACNTYCVHRFESCYFLNIYTKLIIN